MSCFSYLIHYARNLSLKVYQGVRFLIWTFVLVGLQMYCLLPTPISFGSSKNGCSANCNESYCRLAPELLSGEKAGKDSDVFAIGVVLWEIMTFKVPWGNKTTWVIVSAVRDGKRPAIPTPDAIPGVKPTPQCYQQYASLIQACWAQERRDRPTAEKLLTDLFEIARNHV